MFPSHQKCWDLEFTLEILQPSHVCCLSAGDEAILPLRLGQQKIPGAPLAQHTGLYSCWLSGLEGTSVCHDDPWVLRDLQPALPKFFHFLSMKFFSALLGVDAKCQGSKITGSALWLQHRDGGRAWLPSPGSSFVGKEQGLCHALRAQRPSRGRWSLCKLRFL